MSAKSDKAAGELIARCLELHEQAEFQHLKARDGSYAMHKALEEFVDNIKDLADTFAESYQGVYGLIKEYPEVECEEKPFLQLLQDFRKWVMANRDDIGSSDDSELQNAIDEIVTLGNRIMYKLRFFK
jgi:hypothetical protein